MKTILVLCLAISGFCQTAFAVEKRPLTEADCGGLGTGIDNPYARPVPGGYTGYFMEPRVLEDGTTKYHGGTDFHTGGDIPVASMADGVVVAVKDEWDGITVGPGCWVAVRHATNVITIYGG